MEFVKRGLLLLGQIERRVKVGDGLDLQPLKLRFHKSVVLLQCGADGVLRYSRIA